MKNKIRTEKDEFGSIWEIKYSKTVDNGELIVSTKIRDFRRGNINPRSMVSQN